MSNVREPSQDRLVDTKEAAVVLGKHPSVLAVWRHESRGPRYVKYGKSVRYRLSDLFEWIEAHTVDPETGGAS